MVPFAEVVLLKIPKTQHRVGDFEDRWHRGVWVGFVMRSGEHLVATDKGVFRVSTVMRRPPGRRWSAELIKKIAGSPKDPVPGSTLRRIPAFAKKNESEDMKEPNFMPPPETEPDVRAAYIYKSDVDKHGATPGCPGCKAAAQGAKYRARHNDGCRKRFEEAMSQEPDGKKRFEAARKRKLDGVSKICQEKETAGEVEKTAAQEMPRGESQEIEMHLNMKENKEIQKLVKKRLWTMMIY